MLFPLSQTFVLRLFSVVTQSVLPVYLVDFLGYNTRTIGLPIALIWVGNAVGAIVAFYIVRHGSLNNLLGFLLIASSFFGLAVGPEFSGLVPLLVFLGGAGSGCVQPLLAPTMHTITPDERKYSGIGSYSVALSLGLIVGPFVASFASTRASYSFLYGSLGLLCIVFLLLSMALGSRLVKVSSVPRNMLSFYRKTLSQRGFLREFVLNFLYSLTLPVVLSYATVIGEAEYGIEASTMLRLMALMFILSLVIRSAATFSKRSSFDRPMLLPGMVLPISMAAMAFPSSPLIFSLGFLGFSVPHALIYPWTLFNSLQSAEPSAAPAISYLFAISSGAAETASPPAASYVVGMLGGLSAFYVALPSALAAAVWVVVTYRKGSNAKDDESRM